MENVPPPLALVCEDANVAFLDALAQSLHNSSARRRQRLFASQEVWVSEHEDFTVLPVEETFHGLRDVAVQLQTLATST